MKIDEEIKDVLISKVDLKDRIKHIGEMRGRSAALNGAESRLGYLNKKFLFN